MDGLVVVGKSGIMMKPSSAIGMVMTQSTMNSPGKRKSRLIHEVKKTSKLTFPSCDSTSIVKTTIDALQKRPREHDDVVDQFCTYRLQKSADHGAHCASCLRVINPKVIGAEEVNLWIHMEY